MITDEQIRKASLVIAIAGIAGMFAISLLSMPEKLKATKITEEKIGKLVETEGTVSSFSSRDGHVFVELADETGSIKIVMFERTARSQPDVYGIKEGQRAAAMGKVALYRSDIEIQADRIERVRAGPS